MFLLDGQEVKNDLVDGRFINFPPVGVEWLFDSMGRLETFSFFSVARFDVFDFNRPTS